MALSPEDRKALLSEHFLLKHIPDADLEELAGLAELSSYKADETIFNKGETADSMMVVVSGKVRVSANASKGDDVVFAVLGDGEVFGEIALIDGYTRSADAVAIEDTEILALSNQSFLPILRKDADVCVSLLQVMCHRIRHTNSLLEDFSLLDLRRRLAQRLMYMGGGSQMSVRVSQEELIVMVGVNKEAIEQQLQAWENDGLVKLEAGWITVGNAAGLKKLTEQD